MCCESDYIKDLNAAGSREVSKETTLRFQHPMADNPQQLGEMLGLMKARQEAVSAEGVDANPFAQKQQSNAWQPSQNRTRMAGIFKPAFG